jgi:hypothetical protein
MKNLQNVERGVDGFNGTWRDFKRWTNRWIDRERQISR